ncbi:MAG: OmpL47-type beta-barrel domain-containing protein, partial [Clostridia bacterium]
MTSQTVTDRAGNSTTADSPAVNIDKTAPDVIFSPDTNLMAGYIMSIANDALSGVDTIHYLLDGVESIGQSLTNIAQGEHTLSYWAVDRAGNESAHNTISFTVVRQLEQPANIQSSVTNRSITLKWDAVPYASEYRIMRDGVEVYRGNQLQFVDSSLTPNTSYEYGIEAIRESVVSPAAIHSAKTKSTPPPVPPTNPGQTPIDSFASTDVTETTASFSWTAVKDAQRISIEQKKQGENEWVPASTERIDPMAATATVSDLKPGTTYDFRLVVSGGLSAGASNEVHVTTKAETKPQLVSLELAKNSFWVKPQKSTSFTLLARYSNGEKKNVTKDNGVEIAISDPNLIKVQAGKIQAGKQEGDTLVTLSYEGMETTFNVLVSKEAVTGLSLSDENISLFTG